MVQHSKTAVKNERVHVPLLQQEPLQLMLVMMLPLLQKKVQQKELIRQ